MLVILERIAKILPIIADLSLHFISIGKAEDMEGKLREIKKLVKEGKLKEVGETLLDITTFMDEVLHSRVVRNIHPDLRSRYDSFMAELAKKDEKGNPISWKKQELHDNIIIAMATIDDDKEREEAVTELAQCETLEEFLTLVYARGYDKASTPVHKALQSFYKKMRRLNKDVTNILSKAGQGIKKASKATQTAIQQINNELAESEAQSGPLAWSKRMKQKYHERR